MRIPPSLLLGLGRLLLFIRLEAACLYMVSNNGIVQRYRLIGRLREVQGFFWERYAAIDEYSSLKKTNLRLAGENALLMHRLYMQKENLDTSHTYLAEPQFSFITAKVIRNTVGSSHNYLILDKGYKDGITEDMGVITPVGTIGITMAVSENYTYVLSFLNTNQQVSTKIGKTGIFGPLSWNPQSQGMALLSEIPQHTQVNLKDTVYTSGFSSYYPPDIPVGTDEGFRVVNGIHLEIDVKLLQEFRGVSHVMVVRNNRKKEIDSLVKSVE